MNLANTNINMNVNTNKITCEKIDKISLAIIFFMIAIVPNLVYVIDVVTIAPKVVHPTYNTGYKFEMFNFIKFKALYISTFMIFILFMYKVLKLNYELKKTKLNIFTMILTVAIVLSTVVSDYKYISLLGNTDRFEGAISWICYIFIFFVLYNIDINKKQIKLFYFSLFPFLLINSIMGILNFYGINILEYDLVNKIINSGGNTTGSLRTTLYNPNFSSGVGGVIFVMSTVYLLTEENIKNKIYLLINTILSFIIVLTSLSTSGFLTILVLSTISIFIFWKVFNKKGKILWISIVLICNGLIFGILYSQNNRVYSESFGIVERFINLNSEDTNIWNSNKREDNLYSKLDSLSTGRVHIWKKTLDLIKEKPLLGYGFDTYPYEVDNSDSANAFIDKPHNWYLTVWYGCGLVGVIGLVGIILYLSYKFITLHKNNIENNMLYAVFIGILAYSFQGIFNDSFIGTSVIFWILSGLCANIIISHSQNDNIE